MTIKIKLIFIFASVEKRKKRANVRGKDLLFARKNVIKFVFIYFLIFKVFSKTGMKVKILPK